MTEHLRKRPKRLWGAALMNIILGTLSLAALTFLTLSTQVPEDVRPGAADTALAALSTGMLIAWSVLALMGKAWARYLMLVAALLFYGGIMIQNIQLYSYAEDANLATTPLIVNTVRSLIEIAVNLWALLSAETRQYFAEERGQVRSPPQVRHRVGMPHSVRKAGLRRG